MKKILSIFLIFLFVFSSFGQILADAAPLPPGKYSNLEQYPQMMKKWYKKRFGKELDLENPKTYTEKVQWLKLYDAVPLKTTLVDKYLVKDWVKEKIGKKYVVPLFGVWDKFDDIDFDKLPNQFVLKTNIGSASKELIIVKDKSKFDKVEAKKKFDAWLNRRHFKFRMQYYNVKPKIIAEQYLVDNPLHECKVYCFNGKPKYIFYFYGKPHKRTGAYYDINWNFQPFCSYTVKHNLPLEKPNNLNKILKISKKLSKGFSHVRIDFYCLKDGTIKFGEMTFSPGGGTTIWPKGHDIVEKLFGDLLVLPKKKYDYRKIFESNDSNQITNNANNSKKGADNAHSKNKTKNLKENLNANNWWDYAIKTRF